MSSEEKKDIFILDCPEIGCPLVMVYVFGEFCGVFQRRGHKIKLVKALSKIHNDSVVFMGDCFRTPNPVELLYRRAPKAIYIGWYWHNHNVSKLENFIHIYENHKNIVRDRRIRFLRTVQNSVPLLLRANEDPKNIGTYKRVITRHYCYMGCAYCRDWVRNIPFTGIYKTGGWEDYISYNHRRNIYLSSIFALGFQADDNIKNEHVSQRIYEGMAYGCIVLTNSRPAVEQTSGIAVLVTDRKDMVRTMHYYSNNLTELKKKQDQGYEFIRNYGTNEYSFNIIKTKTESIGINLPLLEY